MYSTNNRKILLYGIGGPDKMYAVLDYWCIFDGDIGITSIWKQTARLMGNNPSIQKVYAIDDRRGLRKEYLEAIRTNSIEGWAIFKDILEREGRRIRLDD